MLTVDASYIRYRQRQWNAESIKSRKVKLPTEGSYTFYFFFLLLCLFYNQPLVSMFIKMPFPILCFWVAFLSNGCVHERLTFLGEPVLSLDECSGTRGTGGIEWHAHTRVSKLIWLFPCVYDSHALCFQKCNQMLSNFQGWLKPFRAPTKIFWRTGAWLVGDSL